MSTGDATEDLMGAMDRLRSYVLSVCHSLFELPPQPEDLSPESLHHLLGFARNEVQLYADLVREDERGLCAFLADENLTSLTLHRLHSICLGAVRKSQKQNDLSLHKVKRWTD